ncbi:DNA-O6-methylguanine--protein-cysteine S-methyltransferase /Transcriptional regulator Ada [Parasphingorhabdus marina DSM 22363]|uniref:methylated-DNA--[protein]-cysteine S-methyltransferase n=1 Tax=Parasphingorhabdus marina DSM 22363 TaxID=1123272 RepID=A0A1N6GQ36_9SPHN|nr:bifunctional DNA-binding transcriptional regulator/O6-methylguanine-DNA methyltransferase Ada [Parasphingorhabdus marina]SIO09676.1 DNA-O6-methylguanine--protein-cysteine S-methyltransferase /Transcriptional regulator Ada [Parasphingorhabdus marina DSM 22363]
MIRHESTFDETIGWKAMSARDRTFDGRFVTGVFSTGIYCRPSCAARHPRRENVRFFVTAEEAEAAGLRACLRCRPKEVARDEAAVKSVIDAIRMAEKAPTLTELGQVTGYSPSHLQRIFKRDTGLSPAAYARALRRERVWDGLREDATVTEALYDAGYGSASRFYDETKERLGMQASAWKNGGAGVTIRWAVVPTSLGDMLLAATEKGVCCLSFNEDETDLRHRFPKADLQSGDAAFAALAQQVVQSVEHPGKAANIPLDVRGTAFQEAVWRELQNIPAGETRSYAEIAAAIGKPKAVRAVGSANGANNVAVLIPCHRVIRSDGSMGGYAYGLEIKEKLLEKEEA